MVCGSRRLITSWLSCAPSSVVAMDNLPAFLDHRVDGLALGGYPCALAVHIQANGEPPTRVSVAFGNSEEQLRRRNRRETNEPSDEIRCTSLSEFLSRVVNPVCLPHQRLDAGTHVRMSSIPFLAHLHVQPDSHSLRTRHHRTQFKQSRGRLLACSALGQVRT